MVRGTTYGLWHIKECDKCGGVMTSSGHNLQLSCTQCELTWQYDVTDVVSFATETGQGGIRPDADEDFEAFRSRLSGTSGFKELEGLSRRGPLYYSLSKGDTCPVKVCSGRLKQTGAGMSTQYGCDTCDFATWEKDVS